MVNRPKQVGTDAENRVRDYFRTHGFPYADRLTQSGILDRGDIRLGDGIDFAVEVKGGQGALKSPHSHLRELRAEMANADAFAGAVIAKKPGTTDVGADWVAMMPVDVLVDVLRALYPSGGPRRD